MQTPRFEQVSDFDAYAILEANSISVAFGEGKESESVKLCLFESRSISVSPVESVLLDAVCFGGGLCNALDWCPSKDADIEFLAVSCHSKNTERNFIGSIVNGAGILQIWEIESRCKAERSPVRLGMGLIHNGAVCYSLQWCPDPFPLLKECPSTFVATGLLAAALGNGNVEILAVPFPKEESIFLKLTPWVQITKEQLQGSIVSCLDWQPCAPHDLILLGCWNGNVSIWALPFADRAEPQHLLLNRLEQLALRRVFWFRPPSDENNPTRIYKTTFCTAGHSGHLRIWQCNDMGMRSLLDWTLSRMWILDADMSIDPLGLYVALEDATVRQLPLEMECFTDALDQTLFHVYSGQNRGAIHSVRCSSCNAVVAYAGEDGEIAVMTKENVGDSRYRKPHVCAGAMKYHSEKDVLQIITASEFRKIGGCYLGGTKFAAPKRPSAEQDPEVFESFEQQTIRCLSFSPNGNQTTWLAAGGITGCIRIIRIAE